MSKSSAWKWFGKTMRRDFITPPTLPTETIKRCVLIPASQEWLGLLNAALLMLTEAWRYEQLYDTSLTAEESAAAAMSIYTEYLSGMCGVDNVRQSLTDPCTLEATFDGGETWIPWANLLLCAAPAAAGKAFTPDFARVVDGVPQWSPDGTTWIDIQPGGNPRTTPPPADVPGADAEAKKCLAAARVARALSETYRATFGAFTAGLNNTLGEMNNFLQQLNTALFNMVYSPYEGILESWLFQQEDFETDYEAPALTTEQEAALTCLLLEHAIVVAGVKVQFDHGAIRDNAIAALGINPGTALTYILDQVGSEGIDWAGGSGILSEANCDDCYNWCYTLDFTTGAHAEFVDIGSGNYVAGQGIAGVNDGGGYAWIEVTITTPAAYSAESIVFNTWFSGSSSSSLISVGPPGEVGSWAFDLGNFAGERAHDLGAREVATAGFVISATQGAKPQSNYLRSVVLSGTGASPFGESNC